MPDSVALRLLAPNLHYHIHPGSNLALCMAVLLYKKQCVKTLGTCTSNNIYIGAIYYDNDILVVGWDLSICCD